jgi:hypothetical protein
MYFSRLAADCFKPVLSHWLHSGRRTLPEPPPPGLTFQANGGARMCPAVKIEPHLATLRLLGTHLGYCWERHLGLGGSALKSAAWATRLTAVINVPRGHGLHKVSVYISVGRLGIYLKVVPAPTHVWCRHATSTSFLGRVAPPPFGGDAARRGCDFKKKNARGSTWAGKLAALKSALARNSPLRVCRGLRALPGSAPGRHRAPIGH